MSNTNREGVVTLLWEIENLNHLFTHKLESPVFLSNSLDRTRWKLCLYPDGCDDDNDSYISLSLTRCGSRKPEVHRIVLDCELSIVDEYGDASLVSKQITKHGFINDHSWLPCKNFATRDDVFTKRMTDFIPYNVLHVRCRMWRSFNKATMSELLISHTKVERSHFVWKINNFSCLKANEVKEIHVKQSVSEAPILSYKFCIDGTSGAAFIKIASGKKFNIFIWCEITALDRAGKKFELECEKFTSNDENPYQLFRSFKISSDLLDNKTLYLPMDVLTLQVDCFFWSSNINNNNVFSISIPNVQVCESFPSAEKTNRHGKAENVTPTQTYDKECMTENILCPQKYDKQSMTDTENTRENTKLHLDKTESTCEREKCEVNPDIHQHLQRFVRDMHCMYEERLLSDFTLCAGNMTFPVHKNILSARSSVFKAMFTIPLKEKDGKALDIPDIDGDTLHRMLLFVYSNEMQDFEWKDAINLYFAADKYNIEDLKSITCSILKSKLCVSNVCEILVHADLHEDQELKCSAMEFIANHDDEILGSENWKKIQKKHMPLTMEILSVLYTKIKKRIE